MLWSRKKSPLKNERSMSEEKSLSISSGGGSNFRANLHGSPESSMSTFEESFALNLKESINPEDSAVKTVWTYNIPVLGANEKKLLVSFLGGEFFIVNVPTTDFPEQLYLKCNSINGYLDNSATGTNIIAIFRIREIVQGNLSGIPTFTLIYSLMEPATWDIGLNRTLNFTVADDQGDYDLPLPMTVRTEMKILHINY